MDARTAGELYVASSSSSKNTRDTWGIVIRQFFTWCEAAEVEPLGASEVVLYAFLESQRANGNKPSTIATKVQILRSFYRWLNQRGLIETSPAESLIYGADISPQPRETLTVAELRAVWDAAPSDTHRAVVGVLGFTGLGVDDLISLNVGDLLLDSSGYYRLNVKRAPSRTHLQTLLPPEIANAVLKVVGDRRVGPLILREDGERLDRRRVLRQVRLAGKRAGLPFDLSAMTLTFSLRAIAIEHSFTYLGVVRSVGDQHPSKAQRWVATSELPPFQHGAVRLGQLVFSDPSSTSGLLDLAESSLYETNLPPASAAVMAGAVLERHLRALAAAQGVSISKPERERTLALYADRLKAEAVITKTAHKKIQLVGDRRNDAAHGWFELIDRAAAIETITIARELVTKFPV